MLRKTSLTAANWYIEKLFVKVNSTHGLALWVRQRPSLQGLSVHCITEWRTGWDRCSMESTGCPWQDCTMGISPSCRHDKSQPSHNRAFGLSTQPIGDIWQEMSKDWGLGLNLPMVTADEHQAPLCTQRQSTDTTYAADLSIVVVLQLIHHTSQVHINDFRYIP